jgi:nucleoid DNA-binding protein
MIDKIIKELSLKYRKDERVIRAITNSPFIFTKTVMRSFEDDTPIRLPYFGAFVLRHNMSKMKRQSILLRNILKELIELHKDYIKQEDYVDIAAGLGIAIQLIITELEKLNIKDEQLIQYINDWKDRV